MELFAAAAAEGMALELNAMCIAEILRAFAQRQLEGSLFLNISPQLILQRGFDRARAERFLEELGLSPERVVIELTEDYPTVDFRLVHESLMLYRSRGFRDHRRWARVPRAQAMVELRPEFVKATSISSRTCSDR